METTRKQRNEIRDLLGLDRNNRYPIKIIPGAKEPTIEGHGYYHTTPSGKTVVRYPNAYHWPTKYHHSTLRIEVGEDWLNGCEIV